MSLKPHLRVLYTRKPLFLLKIEEEQLDCLENSEKLPRTEKPRKGVTYSAKNLTVLKKAKEGIVGLFSFSCLQTKNQSWDATFWRDQEIWGKSLNAKKTPKSKFLSCLVTTKALKTKVVLD